MIWAGIVMRSLQPKKVSSKPEMTTTIMSPDGPIVESPHSFQKIRGRRCLFISCQRLWPLIYAQKNFKKILTVGRTTKIG